MTDPLNDKSIKALLKRNQLWRQSQQTRDANYFASMADGQSPPYFWIGCCDSRVSLEISTGTSLGEIFVHRNVANLYRDHDPAVRASLSYAVEVLGVRKVIVCGHYGCGGVQAALMGSAPTPETQSWLSGLTDFAAQQNLGQSDDDWRRLCELNVIEQVRRINASPVLERTQADGITVDVAGLIYDPGTGELAELRS